MATQAFRILIFFSLAVCTSSQKIDATLSSISYTTGDTYGGGNGDLTLTVNWNGTEFSCVTNPDGTNTPYECTSLIQSSGTRTHSIEYSIYVEWPRTHSPLQITEITLTDAAGTTYTIQNFCHPQHMQCTLDTAEGIATGSMPSCTQWGSKDSYDNIQLGSGTKFSVLYVDIPIFGARFANKVVEGGVRPPNLVSAGFTTGAGGATGTSKSVPLSIHWDSALYTCDEILPDSINTPYTCTLSDPLQCPGFSDFWMSIYSDYSVAEILQVKEISFVDETSTTYSFDSTNGNFCLDPVFPYPIPTCTDSTYLDVTEVRVGGYVSYVQHQKLVPFFVPDCVFNHPDDVPLPTPPDVYVGEGSIKTTTPAPEEFSWESGRYGGPIAPVCPETDKPTSDPTSDPTFDPTVDPTTDPTNDPTADPTTEPTFVPTTDPTVDPTTDPTDDPTTDPTSDPSTDPTSYPSADPTEPRPSKAPTTAEPTPSPTKYPTMFKTTADPALIILGITENPIFWILVAAGIFLICCVFVIFCVWWRRKKKKKEKAKPTSNAHKYSQRQEVDIRSPADDDSSEDNDGAIARQDTYGDYDAGPINTQLSNEFGQDEAKVVELMEAIDTQVTLDGVAATGEDVQAGNDAVLDALTRGAVADGTSTGAGVAGATAGMDLDEAIDTVQTDDFQMSV
eukprot:958943_1